MDHPLEKSICNALTFDVEEWFQTILFDSDRREGVSRLPVNIRDILAILDEHRVKATFFISGIVAERVPEVVRQIHAAGHEIASHGYRHQLVYKMTKRTFMDDVGRSRDILSRITGVPVMGYRAPTWSILKDTHWAIDSLRELGFRYDSSIYPVSRNVFACHHLKTAPYLIREGLVEFPPPVFKWLGYHFPFAGGTFLRVYGETLINKKIFDINGTGRPVLVYFHSWEFDDRLPVGNMPCWKRLIQYGNLRSVKTKLMSLLRQFRFASMNEVLARDFYQG